MKSMSSPVVNAKAPPPTSSERVATVMQQSAPSGKGLQGDSNSRVARNAEDGANKGGPTTESDVRDWFDRKWTGKREIPVSVVIMVKLLE